MKKTSFSILIAVVFCFSFLALRKGLQALRADRSPASFAPSKAVFTTPSKLSEQARQALNEAPPATASTMDAKTPAQARCETRLRNLANLSVESSMDQIQGEANLADPDCFQQLTIPAAFGSIESCQKLAQNPQDSVMQNNCQQYLTFYRALVISELYKDSENFEGMETSLLVNKILANFLKLDRLQKNDFQDWQKMTEALMKRYPESLQAVKAGVIAHIVELEADNLGQSEVVQSLIERGLQLNPEDPQLTEVNLMLQMQKPEGPAHIEAFVTDHPQNALGRYALAHVYWNQGQRELALAQLQYAQQLNPDDPRFGQTLMSARDPNNDQNSKIFVIQMGFDFQNL